MSKLNIYYHIVPKDDGYTFLCQDKNTSELYLHKKSAGRNPESLIFSSKQAAEEWIELTRLPKERFKTERFGTINKIEEFADVRCDYGKM